MIHMGLTQALDSGLGLSHFVRLVAFARACWSLFGETWSETWNSRAPSPLLYTFCERAPWVCEEEPMLLWSRARACIKPCQQGAHGSALTMRGKACMLLEPTIDFATALAMCI